MPKDTKITVLPPNQDVVTEEPFTHYVLTKLDAKGKETGNLFTISKKGFAQTYINRTAKPEGNAGKNAQFKVKKKK